MPSGSSRREQRQRRRERRQAQIQSASPGFVKKYRAWLIGSGVAAVLVAVLAFGVIQSSSGEEDFTFTAYGPTEPLGITAQNGDFAADILSQGKPVLLNFWGGSCPPCRAEMPDFQAAFEQFGDEVIFLGLDVGPFTGLGTRDTARALLSELQITYPTAYPGGNPVRDFNISSLPQTIFYDASGSMVLHERGILTSSRLNRILTRTLGATPIDG